MNRYRSPVTDTCAVGAGAPAPRCATAHAANTAVHQREGQVLVARVRRRVRVVSAVLAAVLGASLAGCSSTGGKRAEDERAAMAAGGKAAVNTPRWTFAMVTHSGDGDTFWDIVQNGAEQAAAKDNIKFVYGHDKEAQRQSQLVQSYIDQKVDGLIVSLAKPNAMKDVVAKAREGRHTGDHGELRRRGVQGLRRAQPHRAGREGGRRGGRRGTEQARPEEGPVRPARAGQRRPRAALRRRREDLQGRSAEALRRGHQHARRAVGHRVQAPGGQRPSTPSSRSARRSRPPPSRPRSRPAARPRSTPSTSTPRSRAASRTAPSASPSTSSPTSRATRPSTCCGCTSTTPTPSAAASRC